MSSPSICTELVRAWLFAMLVGFCAWAQAQAIERALMPGPVIEGHAKYESECRKCHQPFDKASQTRLCLDCHKDIAADVRAKAKMHGHLQDNSCRNCHTEHKGRAAKLTQLDKDKFDHKSTGYELKGAHKEVARKCSSCHLPKVKYRETPTYCNSCHGKKDSHKGGLGKECDKCHNETKWRDARFDHAKTKFKLEAGHATTPCADCHIDGKFKDTAKDCNSCHKQDDADKGHNKHFGAKCDKCHTPLGWEDSFFDHGKDTKYRLKGRHERIECNACHKETLYTVKMGMTCIACHRKDDDDKGHKGNLGEKCDTCHNEQGWKTTNFDHDKDTDYPLKGKHADAKCSACHKVPVSGAKAEKKREKLPTTCIGCHKEDDQKNGHKGNFGQKCETCHNEKDWKKSSFDHDKDTKYLLKGKHRDTKCTACHTGRLYDDKLKTDCYSCHRKDDDKSHKNQLGNRCESCHTESDWKVDRFDHNKSRFPLVGGHAAVECKKCHETKAYRSAPRLCNGCHEKDDVHKRRLGIKCESCHNPRSWKSWDFDHDKTKFKLDGAHKKAECYACHKNPVDSGIALSRTCVSCHADDNVHERGFGGQCDRCHVTTTWKTVRR